MTAKKTAAPAINESGTDIDNDVFANWSENPDDEATSNVLAELGENAAEACVIVYLENADDTGKSAQVWRGPPGEYDQQGITQQFGSGDYRIKMYAKTPESNGRVLRVNKSVYCKLSTADERRLKEERERPISAPAQQNQPVDMSAIARMVAETVASAIKAAMPQTRATDPIDEMTKLATLMRTLQPDAPREVLPINPLAGLRDTMELIDMMRGNNGGDGGNGRQVNATGMDIMEKLVDKFGPALAAAALGKNPAMPTNPRENPVQLSAPMEAAELTPTNEGLTMTADDTEKLIMGINFLTMYAATDAPVETYAGLVLDSLPEEALDALLKDTDAKIVSDLALKVADVEKYRAWFLRLVAEIRGAWAENEPPESEPLISAPTVDGLIPEPPKLAT